MKNKKLFNIIGITIAIVILLTWIIPSSTYNGGIVTLGVITPAGIWDWFNNLGISIGYFWHGALFLIFLGGFYGVVYKTGILRELIKKITSYFKGKENWFLVITTFLFMLISSLSGIYLPMFIFVPLFVAILLNMKYNKMVALLATVGAIIIGSISLMYNELVYQMLYIENIPHIWYKLALLFISLGLTILYMLKIQTKELDKKSEVDEVLLFNEKGAETKSSKKKFWPIITIFSILFILLILGIVPWVNLFGIELFDKIHQAVVNFKIGNFAIFKSILGSSLPSLGNWEMTEIVTLLALSSVLLSVIYGLKTKDAMDGFIVGIKKVVPIAIIVILVNMIVVITLNSGFYTTIMDFMVGLTERLNIVLMSITMFLGSILSIDNLYVANYNISIISNIVHTSTSMPFLALLSQTMYGMAMLVAPTSVVLLAGLAYLEVSYLNWLKYIWKLTLMLLSAIFIILVLAFMA